MGFLKAIALVIASLLSSPTLALAITINQGDTYELSFSSIDFVGENSFMPQGGVSIYFQNSTFTLGEKLVLNAYENLGDTTPVFSNTFDGIFELSDLGNESHVNIGFTQVIPPLWSQES